MKKLLFPTIKVFMFAGIFMFSNCSKDKGGPLSCPDSATRVSNAATALANDFGNKSKCEDYKKAVRDFLNSCPNFYSGTQKKQMEEDLNDAC